MSKRLAALIAAAIVPALTFAVPAHARTQYPYRLVDPGTFGGPGSFVVLPGLPITSNGTVLGTADTTNPDPDLPTQFCAPLCDGYVQHAFAWRSGRLADLGALAPAAHNNSAINDLNGNGVGAGVSENGRTDPHTGGPAIVAALFKNGKVISLGTLPGGALSGAQDINGQGQVAGNSSTGTADPFPDPNVFFLPGGTEQRGFVWRHGVMRDLGTLGGPDTLQSGQNNRGQIIGASYTSNTANPSTGIPTIDPYLWQHGHMTDLGTLGGTLGVANGLNNRGEVVGQSDLPGDHNAHPFLWGHGKMIDLGTLGGDFGSANYVNDRGDVAGWALTSGDQGVDGFLWRHGKMTGLPPIGSAVFATAESVNNQDEVVGVLYDSNGNEISAFLWTRGDGYDLNTLVAPSDFQIISADYINNRGEIFGHGVYTSGPNAGDARVFALIRNPSVPLPTAPKAARPLPATNKSNAIALALRIAHRGSTAVPSARH